jgi:hypothetical protein
VRNVTPMASMVFANFMMTSYKTAIRGKPGKALVCQSNEHQSFIWRQPGRHCALTPLLRCGAYPCFLFWKHWCVSSLV